jgi:hypothetical protein
MFRPPQRGAGSPSDSSSLRMESRRDRFPQLRQSAAGPGTTQLGGESALTAAEEHTESLGGGIGAALRGPVTGGGSADVAPFVPALLFAERQHLHERVQDGHHDKAPGEPEYG